MRLHVYSLSSSAGQPAKPGKIDQKMWQLKPFRSGVVWFMYTMHAFTYSIQWHPYIFKVLNVNKQPFITLWKRVLSLFIRKWASSKMIQFSFWAWHIWLMQLTWNIITPWYNYLFTNAIMQIVLFNEVEQIWLHKLNQKSKEL